MSMPGPFELALIFLVILLLFGAKRLPEIGRSLGSGLQEFKKALKEIGGTPQDKDNNNDKSNNNHN